MAFVEYFWFTLSKVSVIKELHMNSPSHFRIRITLHFAFLFVLLFFVQYSYGQNKMDSIAKQQVMSMLSNIKNAIKNDYYDPNPKFAGVDLETRFKTAEEKLKKTEYLPDAFAVISQVVIDLNDSHTRFYPPGITTIVEYGWRAKIIGDKAFVSAILENSDASAKGLKVGDEIIAVNGFRPTRKEYWKMKYYYSWISPKVKLTLDVKSPSGEARQLVIDTKLTKLKKSIDFANTFDANAAFREAERFPIDKHYLREFDDTMVWKMPTFDYDPRDVGGLIGKARSKKNLILDLRGNSGGLVDTLYELASYMFDHEVKIADNKERKKTVTEKTKSKGGDVFNGKMIVLIDADSASASEVFARLMQLEKRAIVLGDSSAGGVMEARYRTLWLSADDFGGYGLNLTMADVFMSDGKSLERIGVIPEELILPTGQDLAERRDPVMTRALELCGHQVAAGEAGKFFPSEKIFERKF